jgi:hypothetical protein
MDQVSAWWRPTRRAIRWSPVLVASGLAIVTLALVRWRDDRLDQLAQVVVTAAVVIGGVAGLHDQGRDVVHPLPATSLRRLAQRLAMLVPFTAIVLAGVRLAAGVMFAQVAPAPGGEALAAFGAVGVALTVVLTRRVGAAASDLAVAGLLGWLVAGVALQQAEAPEWMSMAWWRWPLLVLASATLVAVVAATRGAEA